MKIALIALSLVGCVSAASGQVRTWSNPAGGNFGTASNWIGGDAPDTASESADLVTMAGPYVVTYTGFIALGDLFVSPSATLNFLQNTRMAMVGTQIVNNGTIVINRDSLFGASAVLAIQTVTVFSGSGQLVLNALGAGANLQDFATLQGPGTATNSAGHTIRGAGAVTSGLVNNGTVSADANGSTIRLSNTPKANTGLMQARNGGILAFRGNTITQTGGGIIRADGGTVLTDTNPIFVGGAIEAINGGLIDLQSSATLNGTTLAGPLHVPLAASLLLPVGLSHTGTITCNPTGSGDVGAGGGARVQISAGGSLSGTGTVLLNAPSNLLVAASVSIPSGSAVNANGHTIAGTGNIDGNLTNSGVLSPGNAVGRINQATGTYTQDAQGALNIDLGGVGALSDQFGGNTPKILGGTLNVSYVNGFSLAECQAISIITGTSITGKFAATNMPPMPLGHVSVAYSATDVSVVYIPADFNDDGFVNGDDYDAFVQGFADGDPSADFDGNGFVTGDDFDAYVVSFETGC